jgi:tetratricopeptide (TPR) repeat protein
MILLGIMLFAMANSAAGKCVMLDFGNASDTESFSVLDAYDSSWLFKGYQICYGDTYLDKYDNARTSGGSYGGDYNTVNMRDGPFRITIYEDVADVPKPDFDSQISDDMKNATIETIDIDGYLATYFTREVRTGEKMVPLDGKPLRFEEEFDMVDSQGNPISEQEQAEMNKFPEMDRILMMTTGKHRTVYVYQPMADLYLEIDPRVILTMSIPRVSPEKCVETFKSIKITKVTGENPRFVLNEGQRLFDKGMYEEAVAMYEKIPKYTRGQINYGTTAVIENTGVALYKLGRTNESLAWFDRHNPRSSTTWEIYGNLLKSMNLNDEAEYAFDQAAEQSSTEIFQAEIAAKIAVENPQSVDLLIHALENDSDEGSHLSDIQESLIEFGAPAVDPLIQVLLNENIEPSRRSLAAEALGEIADPRSIDPLILSLKSKDCDVDEITIALGRIGEAAVDPLILALKDDDPNLRGNVAFILGYLKNGRAIDPLKELLNDKDPDVRSSATEAIEACEA